MLLLEEYISNFMCARFYFLYLEFSDFYVHQSLAGQTILHLLFYQAAQYTLSIVHKNFVDYFNPRYYQSRCHVPQ
jgi:hypothetical protein